MAIANKVAGFSLGQADILRRAMGKKKPEEMEKLRAQFLDGAKTQQDSREESGQALRTDPEICRLRVQQVARRGLCRRLLPDRLSEGALSDRVHGRPDDHRHGQRRQDRRLLHGMPRSRISKSCLRTSTKAIRTLPWWTTPSGSAWRPSRMSVKAPSNRSSRFAMKPAPSSPSLSSAAGSIFTK